MKKAETKRSEEAQIKEMLSWKQKISGLPWRNLIMSVGISLIIPLYLVHKSLVVPSHMGDAFILGHVYSLGKNQQWYS